MTLILGMKTRICASRGTHLIGWAMGLDIGGIRSRDGMSACPGAVEGPPGGILDRRDAAKVNCSAFSLPGLHMRVCAPSHFGCARGIHERMPAASVVAGDGDP